MTGDNIVVDEQTFNVSFIDLDNIVIVDSKQQHHSATSMWHKIHVHEKIECNGCFAYVPSDLCAHHLSDLNVYAVCQVIIKNITKYCYIIQIITFMFV